MSLATFSAVSLLIFCCSGGVSWSFWVLLKIKSDSHSHCIFLHLWYLQRISLLVPSWCSHACLWFALPCFFSPSGGMPACRLGTANRCTVSLHLAGAWAVLSRHLFWRNGVWLASWRSFHCAWGGVDFFPPLAMLLLFEMSGLLKYDIHRVKFILFQACRSMNFVKCIQLCNCHHNQDMCCFHHLTKLLMSLYCPSSLSSPAPATTDLFLVSRVFPFPECYVNIIVQYVTFRIESFSLSIILLRSIRISCVNW